MSITAVGFDLDGTLCVPERDRATLLAESLQELEAPAITREEYLEAHRRNLTGETRRPIFADLLEGHDAEASPGELSAEYRERVNAALEPVPGVARLIEQLRSSYRVGLLTNGPRVAQRAKLDALGWESWFDAVIISGEAGAGKPDGAAFAALLDGLGAQAPETAYVGDEPEADVAGAADAGLRAVQVCYPGGPDRHPRAPAYVDRARLAEDLPQVLARL